MVRTVSVRMQWRGVGAGESLHRQCSMRGCDHVDDWESGNEVGTNARRSPPLSASRSWHGTTASTGSTGRLLEALRVKKQRWQVSTARLSVLPFFTVDAVDK